MKKVSFILIVLMSLNFGCKKKEKPGTVKITVTFDLTGGCQRTAEVGLGYSSNDAQSESYFDRGSSKSSPFTFTSQELKPGTYYYKAKAFSTAIYSQCLTPSIKSGAITIKDGEATEIEVKL